MASLRGMRLLHDVPSQVVHCAMKCTLNINCSNYPSIEVYRVCVGEATQLRAKSKLDRIFVKLQKSSLLLVNEHVSTGFAPLADGHVTM